MNKLKTPHSHIPEPDAGQIPERQYNWKGIYLLLIGFLVMLILLLSWFTEVWS
ncbi:MAG: hypothetical protein ACK417_08745 [Bacteroidia bacterium]